MSEKENNKYKSPLRKLVKFFEQSRNQWKEKSIEAKSTLKRLSNRVRYLETTKAEWKQKAILLEKELKQLRLQAEKKSEDLELKKKRIQPTTQAVPTGKFEVVPFHHKYSVDHIMLCISFVLSAASSLRGASRCLETVITFLQLSLPVPSWYTVRLWLLRLGYYKLTRPKELATDWIWIVDHTIQLGEEKALVILGIRMRDIPSDSCLKYEDMEPITLLPVKHSNGEIVYEQLEETIEKTGVPREILGDYGSDLKVGVETFCQAHPETDYVHDIKHLTAILLKRELQDEEEWVNFISLAAKTKKQIQQTSLAFLSPPNQRTKARYMNVDILVQWGQKTLYLLDNKIDTNKKNGILEKLGWLYDYRDSLFEWGEIIQVIGITESHVRKKGHFLGSHLELKNWLADNMPPRALAISKTLLNFVEIQESKLKTGERLLGSSEIIESVFGKQKYLEHEQSKNGFTGLLLGIAAIVASTTTEVVLKAIETVPTHQVLTWCQEHLGQTLQGKRIEAYATPKPEQK
jgi:hypothetical protein